jgi:AGZA family xanthine/uracil permease-like MFS transporter
MNTSKPKLWVPGDWNAFFGFGTNILVNLLTLTGLLKFVLKMPDALIYGRILPATGLMLCLSTLYYAWLAYRLAQRTGRSDVCALPSGISVPHMFVVTFVVMLPIVLKTGDPIKGWEAGLTWVFIQSFVLMIGGFIGPVVRRITPRAALLGTLAGVSITFISLRPAFQVFGTPLIGLVCFAIIVASWFGGVRYFKGIPAGLVAIAVGMLIAWGSTFLGYSIGGMNVHNLAASVANFGFSLPLPAFNHVFSGFDYFGIILVTAIPFGIYDLVEALDNVESAAAAGDSFPTTRVLTADGVVSLIGCMMGNPFINAVYIGHPGWKAMGGRIGYSAATGVTVIALAWFGVISVMIALIPVVAILPILVDGALGAAGTSASAVGLDKLGDQGVLYHGLSVLGSGATLGGLMLAAIAVCAIERQFFKAAGFAVVAAGLTFFGLMHSEAIGIGQSPLVAVSYLCIAGLMVGCTRLSAAPMSQHEIEAQHGGDLEPSGISA